MKDKMKTTMRSRLAFKGMLMLATACAIFLGATMAANAIQPQIPTLQVCNQTKMAAKAYVKIESRTDAIHSGTFAVYIDFDDPLRCDPSGSGYPIGDFPILDIDMSDSMVIGPLHAVTIEQLTSTGKHTPTAYMNGRCKAENLNGCRFWMMLVDNRRDLDPEGTPDVVSFLVFDGNGQRVAYGTGPVVDGDVVISPTSN